MMCPFPAQGLPLGPIRRYSGCRCDAGGGNGRRTAMALVISYTEALDLAVDTCPEPNNPARGAPVRKDAS